MKKVISFFVLMFVLSGFILSQTPQYYNLNTGSSANSFPFNMSAGKGVNSLFLAGEFANPTPIPAGQQITKVYFRTGSATTVSFTNLHILMAQDVITTLTTGTFYAGPYDTVFVKDTTLASTTGGWTCVTLRHPFPYDPTKSLITFVGQCGYSGTGFTIYNSTLTGTRRVWSVGGCPFAPYASGDGSMVNFGVDVIPAYTPPCSNFSSAWTTGLAVIPDGATNCSRVIPGGIIINDTGYVYVMGGGTPVNLNRCYNTVTNTWTTKAVLPVALATTNATTVKDSIYVIGGYTGGVSTAVYKYNPRTDAWVTKTSMPSTTAPADMGIVPWHDSLIICVGGGTGLFAAGASTNAVRYYNVYNDTWVNLTGTSLFPAQLAMMACTIVGDTIYTFGGYDFTGTTVGTSYRGIITPGSPISITWSTIATLPASFNTTGTTYRSSAATIKSFNGGVLIVGGADASGHYNGTAYIYNPCTDAYTTLTSATGSAKSNMGARLYAFKDSVVYLAAGYNAAGQTSVLKFAARCYYCNATGISNNNNNIPLSYSLKQNYPNPFNPVTKISYDIPKSGFVTVRIYDILGKEIATLVNENKNPGSYIVEFDGSSFSSGTYFYRLESNGFIATKKMMLIK